MGKSKRPPNYKNGKIYYIINIINNKKYVGSTVKKLEDRLSTHKNHSRDTEIYPNSKLYVAMREFGEDNFEIYPIEPYPCACKEELWEREKYWIKEWRTNEDEFGYNMYLPIQTKEELTEYMKKYNHNYRINNREILNEKAKECYNNNEEKRKKESKRRKKYYNENHEKELERGRKKNKKYQEMIVKCKECGIITNKRYLWSHLKTEKHLKRIEYIDTAIDDIRYLFGEEKYNKILETVKCVCGSIVQKKRLNEHCKSNTHKNYLKYFDTIIDDIRYLFDNNKLDDKYVHCGCGSIIVKKHLREHLKSNKHKNYIATQQITTQSTS